MIKHRASRKNYTKNGVLLYSEIRGSDHKRFDVITYHHDGLYRIMICSVGANDSVPIFDTYKTVYGEAAELHYMLCSRANKGDLNFK